MKNLIYGCTIGLLTGGTVMAGDALTNHSVSVQEVVAAVFTVGPLVFWMGRKFQKIEDKLDAHNDWLAKLPCSECEVHSQKRKVRS